MYDAIHEEVMCLKTVGIVGGMGPWATAVFFSRLVQMTRASCDQEHIPILLDNNTRIPDRTAYILNNGANPLPALVESVQRLQSMGADFLVMPCNTAHYFYDALRARVSLPFLHMITCTLDRIEKEYGKVPVGLLSTEGTRKAGVYGRHLHDRDMPLLLPRETEQKEVNRMIRDVKQGSSSKEPHSLDTLIAQLQRRGAEVCILGCTELSTLKDSLTTSSIVDPVEILSRATILEAGANPIQGK